MLRSDDAEVRCVAAVRGFRPARGRYSARTEADRAEKLAKLEADDRAENHRPGSPRPMARGGRVVGGPDPGRGAAPGHCLRPTPAQNVPMLEVLAAAGQASWLLWRPDPPVR